MKRLELWLARFNLYLARGNLRQQTVMLRNLQRDCSEAAAGREHLQHVVRDAEARVSDADIQLRYPLVPR